MTFTSPIPFREALARANRAAMPTDLSSADLAELDQELLERSLFSARNVYESFLDELKAGIEDILNPHTEFRLVDGVQVPYTAGGNTAQLRARLAEKLETVGYSPDPDKEGTIEDLGSFRRLNLVIEHNVAEARSYGQYIKGNDSFRLQQYPALELVRFEDRQEKRNWIERWRAAGGRIFPGTPTGLPLTPGAQEGRLIARKDDQIWTAISRFGHPWPPFDFNSGVGTRPVARKDAIALGVITPDAVIVAGRKAFNDGLEDAA